MSTIIEVDRLSKLYRNNRGIRDIHLKLHQGDVYGLLGPNGAGKTTLLKLITGLIQADQGNVCLFGEQMENSFERAMSRVGCMIESADFYDYVSANQYLSLIASFYPNVNSNRITEMLQEVGLDRYQNEKIKHFSTGMKQKLALAAALLPNPELVILDEPTNGLDIEGIVLFRNVVKRRAAEKGTTFLISSHMIHELEQLCNRVGILFNGGMMVEGDVSALLQGTPTLEQYYIEQLQSAKKGDPT
ncbi:ABC transporter ATP-binding protein [Cohnella candidum]|uniref:ABC transporter ATP-binding protein n=1 Tax=Cohnella candidum TaxID=2674991 RepID=A0A3G3JW35_9BACL|nr:ABC transporter ATP-binding protein [Cohnella candidum]AYQ72435.1 ABC transporter ATP-binding protein [Cohnella candidum]